MLGTNILARSMNPNVIIREIGMESATMSMGLCFLKNTRKIMMPTRNAYKRRGGENMAAAIPAGIINFALLPSFPIKSISMNIIIIAPRRSESRRLEMDVLINSAWFFVITISRSSGRMVLISSISASIFWATFMVLAFDSFWTYTETIGFILIRA